MNIWRVKSKTGATVHLTSDMEKTFCGRTIGDDWKFLFLLNDRTEALEHVEGLHEKCNAINLEEWEKEFLLNGEEETEEEEVERIEHEINRIAGDTVKSEPKEFKDGKVEVEPVRGIRV